MDAVSVTLLVSEEHRALLYPPEMVREIEEMTGAPVAWADPKAWAGKIAPETEVIFSTWGMVRMNAEFLAAVPKLRAVFYAAGTVRGFVTPESYARGVTVCAAASANAVPVAEFTVAAIVMSLKQAWQIMRQNHLQRHNRRTATWPMPGGFGARVGLVSMGVIGRRVAAMLEAEYDLEVVAYDPFFPPEQAAELRLELVDLDELFRTSDVVSLHTPLLPETREMFRREHFAAMKPGATLLNTARGGLIREADLCETLAARPDLTAVLDVTDPEPPVAGSPFYTLPNVFLTPHVAGSLGNEVRRMTCLMIEEFRRWRAGGPLQHAVTELDLARMA